jgi:AcrR family transcriptional regulator
MALPTQARSVATRAALLATTVDSLAELGYSATTTLEVARRAGISRGALQHHFATRDELLAAALEELLDRRVAEFRREVATWDREGRADPARLIDLLWTSFDSPTFVAWTEVWIAARTDAGLRALLQVVERRFTEETVTIFTDLVGVDPSMDPRSLGLARDVIFATLTGVAFQRMLPRGQRPPSDYLDVLKEMAARTVSSTGAGAR